VNNLSFKIMSAFMKHTKSQSMINNVLDLVDIQVNQKILDYACGPGLFTIPAAIRVGNQGFVYAADIQPLAEKYVLNSVERHGLKNVNFMVTDCSLNIIDNSIDRILLFDCIHMLKNREKVLRELYRVLSPAGKLCVEVDHISEDKARPLTEEFNLFQWLETRFIGDKHKNFILYYSKK
jgi:ubiquinone/menaquinone biosynthesis C-methylase UbiE